jgi:ribonuclease BN (tRNA processing enzyme)
LKLVVVGSSGTYPVPGNPTSGYLISQEDTRVWCDAGFGTFTAFPIDTDLVDAVVISHQHPDHCADLAAAYHGWTHRPEPRNPVPVYAPQSVWDRLIAFLDKDPACFDYRPAVDGETVQIGRLRVTFTEMDHSVPTVGSRWEANNRALFYTADTGPGGEWQQLAADADLMLSEASCQGASENKEWAHHLTAAEAAGIAREVGAKTLVLTHIPPYLDKSVSVAEAEAVFDRPVRLAVPGIGFDV